MPRWEHAPRDPPRAGAISRIVSHLTRARAERSGGHGRCHSCVGTLGTRSSGPSSGVGLREFATSSSASAPDDDETDDMMVETLPVITAEDVKLQSTRDTADVLRIYKVVRAIRNRGHFAARLDPLGRSLGPLKEGYELMESTVPEDGADIAKLLNGFPNDLYLRGRKVNVGQYLGLHDPSPEKQFFLGNECKSLDPDGRAQWWTVEELMTRLRAVYCGTLSAELNHLASVHKKDWLRRQLEGHVRDDGGVASTGGETSRVRGPRGRPAAGRQLTREDKRSVLKRLVKADRLEGFLARNFPSAKRFGLEGAETLIPGLQAIVESAAAGECPYAVTLPYPNAQLPPKC
jgi:2-oxoglutarate dehydrogenase E1 component